LVSQSDHDGRAATQAALNELTELGYRVVTKESHGPDDIRTVVTWHHIPEDAISRPMTNSTVDKLDGRETGASLEHHSSEHHQTTEDQERTNSPSVIVENPDAAFNAFWDAYPRKKGKGQARTAWTRAAKKADPALIVHGAIQYRQWCQQDGTEAQFIAHPSTWLNGERWTDERDPTPVTKSEARMQGHIALIEELWETENGYPQDKPLQLEG
jgi:hypothetical protein